MQKSIAFFDFDGTITTKDTMLELAKYSKGTVRYWAGILLISPWLIAMKLGVVRKQTAKEKFLTYFFNNRDIKKFNDECLLFTANLLPQLIRQGALRTIKKLQEENTEIVVVSASAENWVAPWCIHNKLQYICTRLEVKNEKLTGKLAGQNCNGPEKVSRIKEKFDTADYENIYCYGDSKGDKPMLQLATHPFFRYFTS